MEFTVYREIFAYKLPEQAAWKYYYATMTTT